MQEGNVAFMLITTVMALLIGSLMLLINLLKRADNCAKVGTTGFKLIQTETKVNHEPDLTRTILPKERPRETATCMTDVLHTLQESIPCLAQCQLHCIPVHISAHMQKLLCSCQTSVVQQMRRGDSH